MRGYRFARGFRSEPSWPGDPELQQRILEAQLNAQTARIDNPWPPKEKARGRGDLPEPVDPRELLHGLNSQEMAEILRAGGRVRHFEMRTRNGELVISWMVNSIDEIPAVGERFELSTGNWYRVVGLVIEEAESE